MKRFSSVLIALSLILSAGFAFAEPKIGVVDLQKIMQTSSQMKTIQEALEKNFKPRRDKLVAMEEKIKNDMAKFKRESTVMSPTQKKDMQKKIIEAQQAFEREGQQYQQELSTAHNDAMEEFYTKIRKAIDQIAANDKFELILQKDAAPFSSAKLDITDSVIKEIH